MPNPHLKEENIRAYILLLSAHFQGFCRDLYSECTQIIAATVSPQLQIILQQQFTANRKLDYGNPNIDNLKKDFNRFNLTLDLANSDPANDARLGDLNKLNKFRNAAAHYGNVPAPGLPNHIEVQTWENSCDGLAGSLDQILYNRVSEILGTAPWVS